MTATIQLVLPTDKPYSYSPLFAKQGDYNSRYYSVTLQSEGKSVSVSDDASVYFNVRRSDGKSKVFAGSVEDGKAVCPLPSFASEIGNAIVTCSVSVIDGESRFTTSNFVVFIQSAESTDTDIAEDENYDALVSLIASVNKAIESIDEVNGIITGVDGADGKSAYEIAVDNGFDGTEEEWLASLKGDTGDAGATGADGNDGVGIVSIERTATSGLVDTYTINLSDGTSYEFTVTNGSSGGSVSLSTEEYDGESYVVLSDGITAETETEDGNTYLVLSA